MTVERVRIARVCTQEKDGTRCGRRNFGDPAWECDVHPGKTVLEPNRPYQGKPTPRIKVK